MQFEVDPRSPVSPGDQLADQVRFAVAAGRLAVGERLPSVRELARTVRLNPNTVGRAWRELELTGVLESRRGSGMYIAPGAVALARTFRTRALAERLGRAVGDALAAGLDAAEVQDLVAAACAAWSGAGSARLDSAHIAAETLRDDAHGQLAPTPTPDGAADGGHVSRGDGTPAGAGLSVDAGGRERAERHEREDTP